MHGDREKAAGIPRAAYFFLGCGAYPDGLIGFVLDAVRLGQHSVPDFTPYHGLASTSGDRRDWTIEVQVHEDVPFAAGTTLREIVVARPALIEDLPEDLKRIARVASPEDEVLSTIAQSIEARIAEAA